MDEAFLPRAPDNWVRLADLTEELGWSSRTLREYIAEAVPVDDRCRVYRQGGGGPELWVSPEGADLVRRRYPSRREFGDLAPATAPNPAPREAPEAPEQPAPGVREYFTGLVREAQEPRLVPEPAPTEVPEAQDLPEQMARVPVARWIELERRSQVADLLEADAERLREDNLELREKVEEAARRAEVAETQVRRARGDADRWRSEAEAVRLAWHGWRRGLDGVGRWALLRRRFPPEPPEFTAGPALTRTDG